MVLSIMVPRWLRQPEKEGRGGRGDGKKVGASSLEPDEAQHDGRIGESAIVGDRSHAESGRLVVERLQARNAADALVFRPYVGIELPGTVQTAADESW